MASESAEVVVKMTDQLARGASAALQGRELDALIAERLFGWTSIYLGLGAALGIPPGREHLEGIPRYSSGWNSAALVVEKMRERRVVINLSQLFNDVNDPWGKGTCWLANAHVYDDSACHVDHFQGAWETAPLAICQIALAALAALEQGQAPEESGDMGRS